jgi:hypothetical protein
LLRFTRYDISTMSPSALLEQLKLTRLGERDRR